MPLLQTCPQQPKNKEEQNALIKSRGEAIATTPYYQKREDKRSEARATPYRIYFLKIEKVQKVRFFKIWSQKVGFL